jgi:hypothetical protein
MSVTIAGPDIYPCRACVCGAHRGDSAKPGGPMDSCDGFTFGANDEPVPCPCECGKAATARDVAHGWLHSNLPPESIRPDMEADLAMFIEAFAAERAPAKGICGVCEAELKNETIGCEPCPGGNHYRGVGEPCGIVGCSGASPCRA